MLGNEQMSSINSLRFQDSGGWYVDESISRLISQCVTGLPREVLVSTRDMEPYPILRLLSKPIKYVVVSIEPTPRVISTLPVYSTRLLVDQWEFMYISKWIQANLPPLCKFWLSDITFEELMAVLQKLPKSTIRHPVH